MAELERDERVVQAYRELGREEPPGALDAAILAASRRRGLRWGAPLAAAATLVLAVGVALLVQREEPRTVDEVALSPHVIPTPSPAAPPAAKAAPAPPEASLAGRADAEAPVAAADAARPAGARREVLAETRANRPAPPASERPAAAAGVASALLSAKPASEPESPERWLERIVELRRTGRDREADESLAEFRRRYPDYRMSEEMRARVLAR